MNVKNQIIKKQLLLTIKSLSFILPKAFVFYVILEKIVWFSLRVFFPCFIFYLIVTTEIKRKKTVVRF
jgi:hypothetical protein